ncbi:agamous-like MADS-box protein AGL62 [Cornus florida]|uniref:agamous-like MADS-box protein AGL62 n=1 Tax=Cornus florida TaxID=4283 RepID=UPI00289CCB2F|nr:agamous-like MADS-box protein AGL62 [Cornus florida]
MAKKPSMGRQKIKMAKIEIKNHLQVTFSKRRSGLFKKASELCTLCGVEAAIVVFSPAGKVFSFGHPNVEAMVDRFITRNTAPNSNALHLVEAHRDASIRALNSHLTQLLNELEAGRKTGEALDRMRKASQCRCWWEAPIDKLGLQELEQLKDSMEELKKNVANQTNKLLVETTNGSPFFATNGTGIVLPFERKPNDLRYAGSSSSTNQTIQSFGYGGHGFF